jgi:hypothetical protein
MNVLKSKIIGQQRLRYSNDNSDKMQQLLTTHTDSMQFTAALHTDDTGTNVISDL